MKLNLDIAPSRVPDDVSHHKRRFFIELLLTVNVKPVMLQSNRITTECMPLKTSGAIFATKNQSQLWLKLLWTFSKLLKIRTLGEAGTEGELDPLEDLPKTARKSRVRIIQEMEIGGNFIIPVDCLIGLKMRCPCSCTCTIFIECNYAASSLSTS